MTDYLTLGTKCFILSDFDEAIKHFEELIKSDSESDKMKGYIYKGTSLSEMDKHDLALECYENACKLNIKSFELNFKKGIALFKLNKFEEADTCFRNALILSETQEEKEKLFLWQNKTQLELDNTKKENEIKALNYKFSNNWYQNDKSIIVTLDCNKLINKLTFKVLFTESSFEVVLSESNQNIKLYKINLYSKINPDKCEYKLLTQKIELTLDKLDKGLNWVTLDIVSANSTQKYPTSSKNKTDFDKMNKEFDEIVKKDSKTAEGNESIMKLFKEIYANADENTKKAMIKSYSTSGGTVFSTNWEDVKSKDYTGKDRPSAPDGQMWEDERK